MNTYLSNVLFVVWLWKILVAMEKNMHLFLHFLKTIYLFIL